MERRCIKALALIMSYLAISLIFVPVLSLRADAILLGSVEGQDQLPGLRRTNDTTILTVLADSDLVSVIGRSSELDLACSPTGNGTYRCTYTFPRSFQNPGSYSLDLKQTGGTPPTTSVSYMVDGTAPLFSRADISQLGKTISAVYAANDEANGGCAGIDKVQLILDENILATERVEGGCQADGIIQADAPGIEGRKQAYLLAVDKLGNSRASDVKTLSLDTKQPALPATFELLRNGHDIEAISTDTSADIRVELRFTIGETNIASVLVDASSLTSDTALKSGYARLTPSCTIEAATVTCSVPNLRLSPSQESIAITITAEDKAGNRVTGDAMKALTIKNTLPMITYLGRADRCEECFLTTGDNDLLATVAAPGGLEGAGLFFTLGEQRFAATNCTASGNAWSCIATARLVSGRNGQQLNLQVDSRSMDDLGNRFTGILEKSFTVDNEASRIIEQPKADTVCPVAGQTLTVTLKARDQYSPRLTLAGDVSAITDRERVEAACSALGNKEFSCLLPIDSFLSVHLEKTNVPLTLSDAAGNTVELRFPIEVCEAETEATPNYISKLEAVSLPTVNKRIASLVPFKVLVPLKLSLERGAKPVQVRRVTCSTPQIAGPSYVMNEFSKAPILVTSYNYQGVWPNGSVDLNCTIDFSMRRGNTVYVLPETEQLNLELPLFGQEIGNPGEASKEKMHAIAAEIIDLQKTIDSKASIDDALGQICQMAENIAMANNALAVVKAVMYALATVTSVVGAGAALWAGANGFLSTFNAQINTYIWPPGWIPSGGGASTIGYLVKYTCALYTCKVYEMGTWVSVGTELSMSTEAFKRRMNYDDLQFMPEGMHWEKGKIVDAQGNPVSTDSMGRLGYREVTYGSGFDEVKQSFMVLPPGSDPSARSFNELSGESLTDMSPDDYLINVKTGSVGTRKSYEENVKNKPAGFKASEWSPMSAFQETWQNGLDQGVSSILEDDWIINPYTNQPYDSLCIPAQLYNVRKEKMLKCEQLKCVEEYAQIGLPASSCDERYSVQHCLYVEGSMSRMDSDEAMLRLLDAAAQIVLRIGIGLATSLAFRYTCPALYSLTALGVDSAAVIPDGCTVPGELGVVTWSALQCGPRSVGCGLFGLALNLPEIMSFIDNPWNEWSTVPASEDYCEGLSHWDIEPDGTVDS